MKDFIKSVFIIIVLSIMFSSCNGNIEEKTKCVGNNYLLENGNYICGKDFPTGIYDITLIDGSGNVFCYDIGLNLILMSKELETKLNLTKGTTTQSFKNAEFKNGNKLEVLNVTIKLTKKQ